MNHPFTEKALRKPRILVAPLDWGLGHATRCIPLIHELQRQQAEVWIAGESAQAALLRTEFPLIPILELPGYRIEYSSKGGLMPLKMLLQASRLLKIIEEEHRWLQEKVTEHRIEGVISDNRYGMYCNAIPSIFITHQLQVRTSFLWLEATLRKKNYRFIEKFSESWIPDHEHQKNSLAGKLSHPAVMPKIPVHYIGHLTRFSQLATKEKKDHLLILLSGPEPQRTIFEKIVLRQLSAWKNTATVIRGLPGINEEIEPSANITVYNHLPAEKLNREIASAEFVIARSGYSSIMDLLALKKKTILVPTPGQTEQVYLANLLAGTNWILSSPQKSFSLSSMVNRAKTFDYKLPELPVNNCQDAITRLISSIIKKR